MVKHTSERLSWYSCDDLRVQIEHLSGPQYIPGDILTVRILTWDEKIAKDDDDENWVDPGAPSGGKGRPSHGNYNDDSEGEEDTQGGEKGPGKANSTKNGKGKGKGNAMEVGRGYGKGHSNGKRIVKQTAGGDDISCAVPLQWQKEMYVAYRNTEGELNREYFEPEPEPTVSIPSDDDTDLTEESDSKYGNEHYSDVDMRMEDEVDAQDGVDLDSDVDMEKDGYNEEEHNQEEEDEEEEN
jgi:hypothetical protein